MKWIQVGLDDYVDAASVSSIKFTDTGVELRTWKTNDDDEIPFRTIIDRGLINRLRDILAAMTNFRSASRPVVKFTQSTGQSIENP